MSVQPEQVPGAQTPAPHRLQTAKCIARCSASPVCLWRRTMHALPAAAAHPALPLLAGKSQQTMPTAGLSS